MDIALWIVAAVAVLLGIAGMVLPLLPGTPLLFGGLWLAAWLDGYARVSVTVVVVLGVMAVLAWVVDYVAATLGVKRVGASGKAVAGAAIGTVIGLFAGLPGLVLGPVIGAMAGEWLARRDAAQAGRAGLAAGLGFIVAVAAKLGIAIAMLGVFAFAWFV
ncbi:MAG: DUF456 domain-containing protein [Ideonella sp.]|nr:DUF456 domain-containing protein [Ideonella sp.]